MLFFCCGQHFKKRRYKLQILTLQNEFFMGKLIDSEIKSARPEEKKRNLKDGKGLYLWVLPDGRKCWRMRYRFNGVENMLSLGFYPNVSLANAREVHKRYKDLLADGVDPSSARKEQKIQAAFAISNSFEAVTRAWWNHWREGVSESHARLTLRRVEIYMLPELGRKPISEINTMQAVAVLRKIEANSGMSETAKRAFMVFNQIMRYAVAHGLIERNPTADIKPSDILKKTEMVNFARIDERDLPELLRKIDDYIGYPLTKYAMQLLSLTFVRTAELRGARWSEIDMEKKLWVIPAERMKKRRKHIVPLSDQAINVLDKIRELGFDGDLIFPSERRNGNCLGKSTIIQALKVMGYKGVMTAHGFRGIASTKLKSEFPVDIVDMQLAHLVGDKTSRAYDHGLYLEPRTQMMQWWGDYLEEKKNEAMIEQ